MDTRKTRHQLRSCRQRGFTFLEVMVALSLLAVSASILIGMQGAAVRRTLRDLRAQQAILAMRSIMSSIESVKTPDLPFGAQDNRPVLDLLQELGQPAPTDEKIAEGFASLSASIQIDEYPMPISEADVVQLRRVSVAVIWGSNFDQSIQVTYIRGQG